MANRLLSQFLGFNTPRDFLTSIKNNADLYVNTEDLRGIMRELNSKGFVDNVVTQVHY